MLSCIDNDALKFYNTMNCDGDTACNNCDVTKDKLDDYFSLQKNIVFERFNSWNCNQSSDECINSLVSSLCLLAESFQAGFL